MGNTESAITHQNQLLELDAMLTNQDLFVTPAPGNEMDAVGTYPAFAPVMMFDASADSKLADQAGNQVELEQGSRVGQDEKVRHGEQAQEGQRAREDERTREDEIQENAEDVTIIEPRG